MGLGTVIVRYPIKNVVLKESLRTAYMQTNTSGHIVNANGATTNPRTTAFWVGDDNQRVAFDFLYLDDGAVVLHSMYGNVEDQVVEDFIYEVVPTEDVLESAVNLVSCAIKYLVENGVGEIKLNVEGFIDGIRRSL